MLYDNTLIVHMNAANDLKDQYGNVDYNAVVTLSKMIEMYQENGADGHFISTYRALAEKMGFSLNKMKATLNKLADYGYFTKNYNYEMQDVVFTFNAKKINSIVWRY